MANMDNLKPVVRLSLASVSDEDTHAEFGRGIAHLCMGVRELGSLNAAAKQMHMAYSKAWRIIKDTESSLGFNLLNRDGAHGSTLTEEGNLLLDAYLALSKKFEKDAEIALNKFLEKNK